MGYILLPSSDYGVTLFSRSDKVAHSIINDGCNINITVRFINDVVYILHMRINTKIMEERMVEVKRLKVKHTARQISDIMGLTVGQVRHCLNKKNHNDSVNKWLVKNKNHWRIKYDEMWAIWMPEGTKCVVCGKTAKVRHHRVYGEKEFAFREIINHRISKERVLAEMNKTEPLCISCHRKVHMGVIVEDGLYTGPLQEVQRDGHLLNGMKEQAI